MGCGVIAFELYTFRFLKCRIKAQVLQDKVTLGRGNNFESVEVCKSLLSFVLSRYLLTP